MSVYECVYVHGHNYTDIPLSSSSLIKLSVVTARKQLDNRYCRNKHTTRPLTSRALCTHVFLHVCMHVRPRSSALACSHRGRRRHSTQALDSPVCPTSPGSAVLGSRRPTSEKYIQKEV
jgi:hypothetical protein